MNNTIERTMGAAAIVGLLTAGACIGEAMAHAAPMGTQDVYAYENTVDVHDIPNVGTLPLCVMEDGSDVPVDALPCIWGNEGSAWLTYADRSLLIVDSRDGNVSDMDLGA